MYTNLTNYGGEFYNVVEHELGRAEHATIACGYASYNILNLFSPHFERIAKDGGESRLLLGMAFYEGMSPKTLSIAEELCNKLQGVNVSNGVYVCYSQRYHGKVYDFKNKKEENVYVGSSNFSTSGLLENIECTTLIKDEETINKTKRFLDFLFNSDNATLITKAEISAIGSPRYRKAISPEMLDDLERYDPASIDKSTLQYFDYPLVRIVNKGKSSLNVYFGKGRLNTTTGKITPRPWYEIELIANKDIYSNPLYPKGDFLAYTDDGYIIPMYTGGDYHKNIRTRHSLSIFGQWLKGKLQKSDALIPLTPVTQETLDAYGKETIRFYKISDGKYYLEF
ncbi:MAG: NgoFVII family restriction endonuclease [Candidatus Omnitrophica bacterium]|nr:NgoFVII family restriction endonuclease [Candidatus Omnitrophota bacterium]